MTQETDDRRSDRGHRRARRAHPPAPLRAGRRQPTSRSVATTPSPALGHQPRAGRLPSRSAGRGRAAPDRVPAPQRADRARVPGARPSSTAVPMPQIELSLPTRRYGRAAELMATAIERLASASGLETLASVARERGAAVARDARQEAGPRSRRLRSMGGLVDVLRGAGYEPQVEPDGTVCLRNCPYDALVAEHRDVTCGMNLAWADGLVDGLGVRASRSRWSPSRAVVASSSTPPASAWPGPPPFAPGQTGRTAASTPTASPTAAPPRPI